MVQVSGVWSLGCAGRRPLGEFVLSKLSFLLRIVRWQPLNLRRNRRARHVSINARRGTAGLAVMHYTLHVKPCS
jgi:hypothetical protein